MKGKKPARKGWLHPNTKEIRSTAFSNDPAKDRDPLIGLEGKTVTSLRPTGEIRIKGRYYDAVAEGAFVDPGKKIKVTGLRDFRLIVEKLA